MFKIDKKILLFINLILFFTVIVLFFIKISNVDQVNKDLQKDSSSNQIVKEEKNMDKAKTKTKESKKLSNNRTFFSIEKVKKNWLNVEKQINEDMRRNNIKIDHIESLAYKENEDLYINVLVFRDGYEKTIYSFTFKLDGNKTIFIHKEEIYNAIPISK